MGCFVTRHFTNIIRLSFITLNVGGTKKADDGKTAKSKKSRIPPKKVADSLKDDF
jgi:hypothetical protein